jgi:hypothetical protein
MDAAPAHVPNQIPLKKRLLFGAGAVALFAHGLRGLWIDDLVVFFPRKHRRPVTIHFHGVPALIAWVAIFLVCVSLLSVIVDHYDRRRNERFYAELFGGCQATAWAIAFLALVLKAILAIIALVASLRA